MYLNKMYRFRGFNPSSMVSVDKFEGEPIELKVRRIEKEGEPISDGAPEIFTERKDGVKAAYNIRTDRWEIAAEAMDVVHRSKTAARAEGPNLKDEGGEVDGAQERAS